MEVLKIVYSFHFCSLFFFCSTKVTGSNKPLCHTRTQSIKQYEMGTNGVCINDSGIFFNWDSLHTRLHSHCKAWSYKKRKNKEIKAHRKSVRKNLQIKGLC